MIINLLIALPLFLSGILIVYLLSSHIEVQSHLYDICRTELAQTQSTVSQELVLLMALNPLISSAKWVSVALKLAEVFVVSNPALTIIYRNLLNGFESVEKAIIHLQKKLIWLMERTMNFGLFITKKKMQSAFYTYRSDLDDLASFHKLILNSTKKPEPAVEPTDTHTELSTYKTKVNFVDKQKLYIDWAYQSTIVPHFSNYAILNKTFKGKCIFSIKEGEPWPTIQIAVR